MGSALGAIGGGIASAATSRLLGGGSSRSGSTQPIVAGISGGGLTITPTVTDIGRESLLTQTVTSSAERQGLVSGASGVLSSLAQQLKGILPQVQTGFGRLTEARKEVFGRARQAVADRRRALLGDLQENLASRRIGGSSFATDALSRASSEFEKVERDLAAQESEALALSALEELDFTVKTIGQISDAQLQSFQIGLGELNIQAELAANLVTNTATNLTSNANIQAQLAAQAQQGRGALAGTLFAPAINQIQQQVSNWVTNLFKPAPTPP